MPTLFFVGSYRVVIYTNDHEPAHVHALGPGRGGHAKFDLGRTPNEVALVEAQGIPEKVLYRIAAAIIDRHKECRNTWNEIHGN